MGLVARVVEAAGIPTVLVSTGRDLTALVRPPRSLFINAPMGNPFGRANQPEEQRRILRDALELASTDDAGVLIDHEYQWHEPFSEAVEASLMAMAPRSDQ